MSNKKKSSLSSGLAILLAALLVLVGGTYAYRSVMTETVVNAFDAQIFNATLYENTGSEYEITSGGSSEKDPTVDVTIDTAAYVFVEVEPNDSYNGKQIIQWTMVDKWTQLEDSSVYYQLLETADSYSLQVLEGNQVTYPTLTDQELLAISQLTDPLTLTFTAYAIEAAPFDKPSDAWEALNSTTFVSSSDDLANAISDPDVEVVALSADIELSSQLNITSDITIEGNGYTIVNEQPLTVDGSDSRIFNVENLSEDTTITISDLTIDGEGTLKRGISLYGNEGEVTLNLDNVTMTDVAYYAINVASNNTTPVINVTDSSIEGWCSFQTWSAGTTATFDNCTLVGVNDKTYNAAGWNNFSTLVVNTSAMDSTITLKDCTIEANQTTGNVQKIIDFRTTGGTLNVNNSTMKMNGETVDPTDKETISYYDGVDEDAPDFDINVTTGSN